MGQPERKAGYSETVGKGRRRNEQRAMGNESQGQQKPVARCTLLIAPFAVINYWTWHRSFRRVLETPVEPAEGMRQH